MYKRQTIHYAEDLSEQIANSPLMAMSGYEIGEEEKQAIDNYVSYLTSIYSGEKKPFDLKGLWQRYKEGSQAMESFKEADVYKRQPKGLFPDWSRDGNAFWRRFVTVVHPGIYIYDSGKSCCAGSRKIFL